MTVNKEVYTGTRSIFLSSLPMMENRLSAYLFSDGIFNDRILGNSTVNDSKNDFNPLMIDLLKSAVPKIERSKVGLYKDSALKGNRVLKDYNGSMDGYADVAGYSRDTLNIHTGRSYTSENPIRLSFQLMTRAEPAAMVIETIKSLLAIKADDDEILIVDNNNTQTTLYEPLAQFCAILAARHNVHFYHIDSVAGFKAGALNLALGLMDPNCSHIVVVDSDYKALPQARISIANAIERYPSHALLQFPQFYRDAGRVDIHSELNHYFNHHLYRPFNRKRALSTGTYAVIRRRALLDLGGWSGASITEDAQMGVLMHGRGLRSQFVPEVIATGLLPTTLHDLMSQRRRWIYGNMQVLNTYFSTASNSSTASLSTKKKLSERLAYMGAHLSQLSAWVNFTGIFIVMQLLTLLIITGALLFSSSLNIHALLAPLYIVYASYAIFLGRRLWAYMQDSAPLNQQTSNGAAPSLSNRLRVWAVHLNFWELGALSWWPVLWGQKKPFICTPKQELIRTRKSVYVANLMAMPKVLLMLNITTAIIVSPFSLLYSPLLFGCAVMVCILKVWAAKVMLDNYSYEEYQVANKKVAAETLITKNLSAKSFVTKNLSQPHMISIAKSKDKPLTSSFKDDNAVNF
ncbi:glycosyltransferase family 2 protein [Psychrobacter sp. Sarcosine-3u-12]|uniref:glycosyltransferase family 2 protein n=1 Tax=Psychrobacter sp. Sarcosine-3u-12 TaxID=2058325 RepID=UPI0012FF3A75|nr:glycosyltransferase family 2 protein [Psychrobacter sp. Sarcosine-3u-12]